MQYWTRQRTAAAVFASQLAAYYNSISGNDSTLDPPSMPTFELTSGPPEVPPGIEARAREIARQIKGHSAYAEADGTALGIIGDSGSFQGFGSTIMPTIQTAAAGSNYRFSVTVTMRGASDAWQVWATLANENKWSVIATATGKSAEITWTPKGETRSPEMLNVRIQLRKNNQDYGEPSAISPVTVNP
jgi:hypothetical protein